MNPIYSVVKEEYPSAGSSACGGSTVQVPQPIEGLYDAGPPPFLTKIYDMVDDQRIDQILSWSREGQSFVVWDPHAFSIDLLPRYFKHNNFSSFVRQLNTYGFRKIDPDVWEFANESFLRGQRHILKNIKRRKTPSQVPLPEETISGLNGAFEHLRNDKQVLMLELVNLRQQQQNTRAHLQAMELRIQGTEEKQQKMMSFLAKAMQNPEFVKKLAQNGKKIELEEAIIKKRRQQIDQNGESSHEGSKLIKVENEEFGLPFAFQVSELETLALEMQGFSRAKRTLAEEPNVLDEGGDQELDEEFWEALFTERSDEQIGINQNGEVEDVFLAYKLDFLG